MWRRSALILCFWLYLASPALADQPSADALKQALTAQTITVENYGLDEEGLNAFYAARDFRPAWNFAGARERQRPLPLFLDSIEQQIAWHGLQQEDYAPDLMRKLASANDDDSRLKLELFVTDTLLHLAHDLHGDDIDLDQLYPGWKFKRAEEDIPGKSGSRWPSPPTA